MSKTKGQLAPAEDASSAHKVEAPQNPVDLNSIPDDVIARKYDEVRAANPTLSNDDVARRTRDLLTGRSASAPAGTATQGTSPGASLDPAFAAAFQDWGRQARLNAPVYPGQRETYQKAYHELYDRLTGATYQERGAQLQALKDAFTPRREVTYIDPQKEMARLAGMNVDPRVTVRNYDPENPDGRLQLFVPEGARVLTDKTYDDEDHYSPRVKAEMLRQEQNRKRYWNNKMRESIAVARGEESFPSLAPEAIKPEGKRKTVGWLDKIIEGGDEAFDILTGLTANPVDVTRYGLARLSNLAGLTDTPEEQFDESWRMLRGRAERGVKAVTNPETPGEMLFSLGVDALTTYLTVGGSQAVTGLNTAKTLGTAAKTLAGGAMTNLGTSTMIDAVKKGYYDPVARGKRTFSPREARDYLQDTYGVYAGSLSDDEAQKLARAMNNQMADATFNLNPYGMGDKHPVLQGIMYGLDAGVGMLGGAGNFDAHQEQETITQLAPKLFDLQAQANTLESANFPKDVHDLLELVAQGEAKRKSMPEAAKWAEQITAALPFMYRLVQEQKMLGAAGEINLKLGLKRLMRDATELLRSPEMSAALTRLGTALFADGPETLGKIMVRSYAGALTEGITPVARDGQYLYGKMIEDGASPGEAFFGSYFTGLTGRAFERISESGLVPLGQFGNALSKSFFRRAGTNIFRRAFGEYGEEAATDVATYLTEEGANVPEAYRQQPFRPIMLGGGFAEAMDGNFQNEAFMQALGEFVVSAGIGAIMGTARLASRPFQTMHGGIQALQNGGHFMSYVDRGLREKQGWTEDKIRSTPAIDRATEYYAAKYDLPDVKKERLRQAIELNVVGKGASALAETIARDYDAFFRLHGGVGSFEKLREEMAQDRETEEMSWFWKPEVRQTAASIAVAQDTKDPVAGDPHAEAPPVSEAPPMPEEEIASFAEEVPTGSTPAGGPEPDASAPGEATGVDTLLDPEPVVTAQEATAADEVRNTDETGRRWYTGPRGGTYYIRPDGRKIRSKAVPAGVTPRESRTPEEEPLPAEPLVPPTIVEPSVAIPEEEMIDLTDDAGRVVAIDPSVPRDESGHVLLPPAADLDFDLQRGSDPATSAVEQQIRDNPALAKRLLRRFRAMFPWIRLEEISGEVDADGRPVYGKSSRLAFWIGLDLAQGRLDTIPHEYGHQFVRMFRGHDLVEAGITQYGSEEALVERMGKEAVARADDGFMVSWMKDFTQTVREVFKRSERDYARELSRQLYKGNRTMTQQTARERFMHGRANITPTNRDILMREAHLGRLQEGVDFQSGAPTVGAAEAAVRDRQTAAAPPPRTKAPDQSRPTTTTFEGAIEEHTRPGRALATHIKAQTGVEMPPMSDADVLNILELPSPRAAIDAIMQHTQRTHPLLGQSDKRVRDVVHRWVARNWDRRDFPKIDVWIDTDESGKTGFRVDVNQSVIERDESGRVTNVNLGTYTNDKGNRLVTWETEPLLVKMAHVAEFFEKMGLTPRRGASNLVSRINTIGTTSKETFDYTELGTLAGEHPYTYARMADHLAREGFILIGPPGKNDSFVVLNVDMTAQMPITPAVFTAYAQALDQYEKYMDRSKPGWRETPSGKQHLQMRRGLTEGYALDQNGQLTPDIAKLNGLMTLTQKRQALQTAFLTWSMGPEWPSKGIKVFKYLNTLTAAEQQSIAEFADEAVREAAGKAMEEYRKTLPADQQGVHLRAQNGLTEIVAPNVSQEEIAKGDHKKDWNLAALLATKGYTLTKGGVAFKMKDGELVPGSVRMVMAIADHDTYLNGVPLGDGSSLISPAASVVQDRAHGDPNGDVKFHKVRMFIPWRGSKPPLLWKGQFDVAAGTVLDVMERNGIGLVVFDSTVKVGRETRARKHKDPKDKPVFQNITDLVKEGAYGNMAGTDWYLVDPAVISKANDATSKPGHTTSLVTQLLYANAISPIVSEKWAGVYQTLRRTVARLSRSTRDFLYEVHASPSLLRAVYERGEEDEHSSEPEQVLRAMLRADKGRTPALTALPHWRAATNSASIRTVLEQLFDDQGSMRVIGQGAFLRADNGTLDGVNIAAIIEAGGVVEGTPSTEAAMKYCNITEILPYGEQGVDPEMHEEIMRKMWQEENAERHKGTKVTKLLEDQLQEWRSYSDEAFRAMLLSRGWGIVEAGGKRYMIKGDGRLKARVDGAVPVVVAYNKAKKMGLGVGDKMMAVAYPTDAPHNAQSCVIVGVSKGVNDWMSYSSEVVQKLGKDHDGDKLSLYGPSAGYWRREVARLEGELKASFLKGRDEEAMEDIQREIDIARARARHGFQELPQEAFDAVWNHYASDDVQEYVKALYEKAGIDGPFDDAAVQFIRNTVTTFVDPWQRAIDKENARRAKKGEPPLTPAEIASNDKYQNPYPYSIFSAKGDAMLMKDYVGKTGDLIAYVAGTRNKIEYMIQNFRAIAESTGRTAEDIDAMEQRLRIPDESGLSPLDKIAVVGSLLTHHAVDAPKEEAIFGYGFSAGAYYKWARETLGFTKEETEPFERQYKLLREAMKGTIQDDNGIYMVDQHEQGKKAIPEARLTALQLAHRQRAMLGAESLMDMLANGFMELGDLSMTAEVYQTKVLPRIIDRLSQKLGLTSTFGPVDKEGTPHLFTSQSRTRELTEAERASTLGALRQGVRDRDGRAREVAFALLQAQAYNDFATSGYRPGERHGLDETVKKYVEMLDVNHRRNPLFVVLPEFVRNVAGHLAKMKTPTIETEHYTIDRVRGIIDKATGAQITPERITAMLTARTAEDVHAVKKNANEIWNMIKEVSTGFWQNTGKDVVSQDDWGNEVTTHYGTKLPILTGAQSQRLVRETMDAVLRDQNGMPVEGRYQNIARVLLNNELPFRMVFRFVHRSNEHLAKDRLDLDTYAPEGVNHYFTTRQFGNTVNPPSYQITSYGSIAAENHLNLAGFGYMTPEMQETFMEGLRESPEAARALHRITPVQGEDIDADILAVESTDALRRKAERAERAIRYLYPKVKELVGMTNPNMITSGMYREAATEVRELFAKAVADYSAIRDEVPGVFGPKEQALIAAQLDKLSANIELLQDEKFDEMARRAAEFDFQTSQEGQEVAREYRGLLRQMGRVVGLMGEWFRLARANGLFSFMAPYTVAGKIGTIQPTRKRTGAERIGPTLLFRLATPDKQRSPKIHSNLVSDLSMYTSRGVMRDELGGEEFGDVDLAHAMIRATAEKITSDESAVQAALDRILAPLAQLQDQYPDEWVRMNQMLLEELHRGTRFPVKIVFGEKVWSWQFPDGSTASTEIDQLPIGDLRGIVEKHFGKAVTELAGKKATAEEREAALTQAAHLLKMTMQLRKFIAQNNYMLFAESVRIKQHRLAHTPNLSFQERTSLEKQIESDRGLQWRIASGEFYFPLFYRPEYFEGNLSKETRRGSEDAFTDLLLNTASARQAKNLAGKQNRAEMIRDIHLATARTFIQRAVSPEMYEAILTRGEEMNEGERLSYFREEMASILRGSDNYFGVPDVKRDAHTLSGGLGMNAFDAHTMQRAVDIDLLMNPAVAHAISLPRPALDYLDQNVGSSVQRMMNNHLNALLGNVAKAVQAQYIDPMRGNSLYDGTLRNWDRFMNGVLRQKNFTQRLELSQLIAGEDVMLDVMEARDEYDPETSEMVAAQRRVTVRMTYRGTRVTPDGKRHIFTFSSNGMPAEMSIAAKDLAIRVRHYDKTGEIKTERKRDWTYTDMRSYVRDQGRWMEALARKNPERWAGLYTHVAPYWKWVWDTMSTLGGVFKLGWNPISAVNNVLYQVKTTAWRIGTPEYRAIDKLLKSNDPSLEKEIKEILYALPVYNWEFIANKVSEGTGYEQSSYRAVLQSVLLYNDARSAAEREARQKGLVGLQEETFVTQTTMEKWQQAMLNMGFKLAQMQAGMGTTSELVDAVRHSSEVRKAVKAQALDLAYRMFQVTEQMNRAMATTTAWNKTRGWQEQQYRLFDTAPVKVGNITVDVRGGGLSFDDLPRALKQRILRTQGIYARMQDEAVNYDYSNIMRPPWLRQPLAQFAFKFGIFTMASYVHRTRELGRLMRDRGQKRYSKGKEVSLKTHLSTPKTVALDRTIAFDPSMVTEAEWMTIMEKIAPTALGNAAAVAKVKAEVVAYLKERGITLEASQLDPVWNAQKYLMVNLVDKVVKSWITLGLVVEPASVFFWSVLDLMGNLTGWADDDDEIQADPVVQALKADQLRRNASDISRNGPIPGGLLFSNLLATIMKWAVLSKVEPDRGLGDYIAEYFKDDANFLRDPSFRMLTNLVASYIPALRTGADIAALAGLTDGKPEFGDPTSLGELLGRWVDVGKKDYMEEKYDSERENVREMIHKAARTGKGYNPFKRTAEANLVILRQQAGRADQQMFRSNAAGGGRTDVGEFEVTLEGDKSEMLWLERIRLGEGDKAYESLVDLYLNRMIKETEKERMVTSEDMTLYADKAIETAARRVEEWKTRMEALGIGQDLRGVDEMIGAVEQAIDSVSEQ